MAPDMGPLPLPTVSTNMGPSGRPTEHIGFPTYAQYKQVENTYLQSLTPRRQGKALISQAMFDRIWDVLQQPESQGETAQFRFWARKMFTISKNHPITLGQASESDDGPREVLLHDNLLVAIQEQLYDLLCYCHGSTGHGGRDKTCALIRKHYTWVPKDLVSNFIKACPTCIMKKCGSFDTSLSMVSSSTMPVPQDSFPEYMQEMAESPDLSQYACSPAIPWSACSPPGDSNSAASVSDNSDPLEAAYREAIFRARKTKAALSYQNIQSAPMIREVSLYQGLPNGWHYHHTDYASAYTDFMRQKDLGLINQVDEESDGDRSFRRPRIPSILPLWGPNDFPHTNNMDGLGDLQGDMFASLDSLGDRKPDGVDLNESSMAFLLGNSPDGGSPMGGKGDDVFRGQIDPFLLKMSEGSQNVDHTALDASFSEGDTGCLSTMVNVEDSTIQPSPSLKRATPAPPPLDLDSIASDKSFNAFLNYREDNSPGSPDSPMMPWPPARMTSPTSSVSSFTSRLSAFPLVPGQLDEVSPASSTFPTPTEEVGKIGSHQNAGGWQQDGQTMGLFDDHAMEFVGNAEAH